MQALDRVLRHDGSSGWVVMAVSNGEGGQGGGEGAGHAGGVGVRGLSRHLTDGHVNHLVVLVDISAGHACLGGSALVQVFKPLGDAAPDCDTALLKRAFRETQRLLRERVLLAGHDRSDGGLLTTVLEMCFGGDCGCEMDVTTDASVMVMDLVVYDAKVLAAYEAVQVPSLSGEDTGSEPREGDGERRGGAGPVGDDLLRAGQAAVEPRLC